jgi:hypothetical protein
MLIESSLKSKGKYSKGGHGKARGGQSKVEPPPDLIFFRGYIDRILYSSPTSSWYVALLKVEPDFLDIVNKDRPKSPRPSRWPSPPDQVKTVGVLCTGQLGVPIDVQGRWEVKKVKGEDDVQFSVYSSKLMEGIIPDGASKATLVRLLTHFDGVGPAWAGRIVEYFHGLSTPPTGGMSGTANPVGREEDVGKAIAEDLNSQGRQLALMPGMTEERLRSILSGWEGLKSKSGILAFLYDLDLGPGMADRVIQVYDQLNWNHERVIEEVKKNPYRLIDDVWGVGFLTADRVAIKLGFRVDSNFRKVAALQYILEQASQDGHTWISERDAMGLSLKLIGQPLVKLETIEPTLEELADDFLANLEEFNKANAVLAESPLYMPKKDVDLNLAQISRCLEPEDVAEKDEFGRAAPSLRFVFIKGVKKMGIPVEGLALRKLVNAELDVARFLFVEQSTEQPTRATSYSMEQVGQAEEMQIEIEEEET